MLVSSFPVKPTVGQTYSSNGLNWKWGGTTWNVDFSTSSFTNVTITGTLSLVNTNITGVNSLAFNDPGADEGISWLSGNLWKIYESPNDNTNPAVNNAAGNLQFVQNTTRRLTIDSTTGDLTTHKNLYIGDDRTSTAGLALQIGVGRTDSGYAFIDLVGDTTHTDYGLRIIRNNNGANADSTINHKGTGALRLITENAGSINLATSNTNRLTIDSAGATTFSGNVTAPSIFSSNSSGSEGGQIELAVPVTTSLAAGNIAIDIYNNSIRIYETGGTVRGASLDISSLAAAVGSRIATVAPRVTTTAYLAAPVPDMNTTDFYTITAASGTVTFGAPTGTLTDGRKLMIRVKDNGTARTLAWNAIYRASSDLTLPTTTVISKTLYLGFIYNSTDTKWDLISKLGNF